MSHRELPADQAPGLGGVAVHAATWPAWTPKPDAPGQGHGRAAVAFADGGGGLGIGAAAARPGGLPRLLEKGAGPSSASPCAGNSNPAQRQFFGGNSGGGTYD